MDKLTQDYFGEGCEVIMTQRTEWRCRVCKEMTTNRTSYWYWGNGYHHLSYKSTCSKCTGVI